LELGEDVLDAPNHPGRGFFSWSVKISSIPSDEIPAPDGEAHLAMSLYFAAGRRGNDIDIYYYRAEADPTNSGCLANALSLFKQKSGSFSPPLFAYSAVPMSFIPILSGYLPFVRF